MLRCLPWTWQLQMKEKEQKSVSSYRWGSGRGVQRLVFTTVPSQPQDGGLGGPCPESQAPCWTKLRLCK